MKKLIAAGALAASALLSAAANAVVLAPGTTEFLNGTTFAEDPRRGGTIVLDELRSFTLSLGGSADLLSGNVQERVVRSGVTGTLIFSPRLRDLQQLSGIAVVTGLKYSGFGSFVTDVEFRFDSSGVVAPISATRSVDGDMISFDYDDPSILPPADGRFLSILTTATTYARTGSITVFGYRGDDRSGPLAEFTIENVAVPTPVPGALLLMVSGVAALGSRKLFAR